MDHVFSFIQPELFILVIFLYCVGLFLKLFKGFQKEWMIPYLLLLISFVITLAYIAIYLGEGFSASVVIAAVIQSVLVAAVTVFGNELISQFMKRKQ